MKFDQKAFLTFIKESFCFLKNVNHLDDLVAKSIPLEKGTSGYLMPISSLHLKNPQFLKNITDSEKQSNSLMVNSNDEKLSQSILNTDDDQIFLMLVDQFQNEIGCIQITVEQTLACSLKVNKAVLFNHNSKNLFKTAILFLANYIHENFVVDQFTLNPHLTSLGLEYFTEAGFIQTAGKTYQYRHQLQFPPLNDILTAGPTISAREACYALDATRYGWNSEWSKYIKKFESTFAKYIGVEFALSTSSCTGAIHIALKALDIGPGDEVIVPEMTWVATASAIRYVGATPIFCDIDENNWCIDTNKIEKLITSKTKCIIPVHVYGHPADMNKIMEISKKHNIYVIEDAAPSIGAECRGQKTGSFGHFACFSFQGAKLLVTGEGGMLVTNDPELYKKAYGIWDHGRTPGTFWINEVGLKYKMANVVAAIGLAQLERAEEQIRAKRRIHNWYRDEFKNFSHISLWKESDWARSIYWMSSLVLNSSANISRDEFFKQLKLAKIDTRPTFPAISQYPMWNSAENPTAKKIGDYGVNLPSGVCLKEEEVRYVAQSIKKIILQARNEL